MDSFQLFFKGLCVLAINSQRREKGLDESVDARQLRSVALGADSEPARSFGPVRAPSQPPLHNRRRDTWKLSKPADCRGVRRLAGEGVTPAPAGCASAAWHRAHLQHRRCDD